MNQLIELAFLLRQYNQIGTQIATIIGRPAQIGHVGEFIAAQIFDIELEKSASAKAIDGRFRTGALAGQSVNIKWYAKHENILDITPAVLPDYYLVMTGPKSQAPSSQGGIRPWLLKSVYLFDTTQLLPILHIQGVKVGIATSVRSLVWNEAMIYPQNVSLLYQISDVQKVMLDLFAQE